MRQTYRVGDGLGTAAVFCGLAAAVVFGGLGGVRALRAADAVRSHLPPTWHAVETANFRILSFGNKPADSDTAEICEAVRRRLCALWHIGPALWSPKCEIVLHPSHAAYLREVGAGGRGTLGSALVNRREGRITARRLDISATDPLWSESVLAHEMTHLVLADRFAGQPVPRWVDEGAAILADPPDKQTRHRQDLDSAVARCDLFRVHELVSLVDYPAPERWGAFYGQSASLVAYLIRARGEISFLTFIDASLIDGYEAAARKVYQSSLAKLERGWRAQVDGERLAVRGPRAQRVPLSQP